MPVVPPHGCKGDSCWHVSGSRLGEARCRRESRGVQSLADTARTARGGGDPLSGKSDIGKHAGPRRIEFLNSRIDRWLGKERVRKLA